MGVPSPSSASSRPTSQLCSLRDCGGPDGKEPLIIRMVQQEVREETDPAFCIWESCLNLSFSKHMCKCKHMHILCVSTCKAQIVSTGEQNTLMKMSSSANRPDVLAVWYHTAG